MKQYLYYAIAAAACASPAHAAPLLDIQKIVNSVDGEYLTYSGPFGSRRVINAESRIDAGKTKVSLRLAHGTRHAGNEKFQGARASIGVAHDWSERVTTHTAGSIASGQPVFVNRNLLQEVSYKAGAGTVLTAGARYARYFGDVESLSYSLGASKYFGGGMIGYRFSEYKVEGLGKTRGHLVSASVNDPHGSNQLWLGHGNALHDLDWLPTAGKGKFSSIEYRRVQPISRDLSLMMGVKRMRYEGDHNSYSGTGVRLGMIFGK